MLSEYYTHWLYLQSRTQLSLKIYVPSTHFFLQEAFWKLQYSITDSYSHLYEKGTECFPHTNSSFPLTAMSIHPVPCFHNHLSVFCFCNSATQYYGNRIRQLSNLLELPPFLFPWSFGDSDFWHASIVKLIWDGFLCCSFRRGVDGYHSQPGGWNQSHLWLPW